MTSETALLDKRVLIVDSHLKAREARARRLIVYGVAVDAVSTVREARFCLRNNAYDLVLLSARENPQPAIAFRQEIHRHYPKQRVAFLVGPPRYISFTFGENVISMETRSDTWADVLKYSLASA